MLTEVSEFHQVFTRFTPGVRKSLRSKNLPELHLNIHQVLEICVMYLYICVHTQDLDISVSGPWPFLLQVSPGFCLVFHSHSTSLCDCIVVHWLSYCPVIVHPGGSVSYWHLSSFLIGLAAGLVISLVNFIGFKAMDCSHSYVRRSVLQSNLEQMMMDMISTGFSIISAWGDRECDVNQLLFPSSWPAGRLHDPPLSELAQGWVPWDEPLSSSFEVHIYVARFRSLMSWLHYPICFRVIFRWSPLTLLLLIVRRRWLSFVRFHWSYWWSWYPNCHSKFEG